MGTEINCLVGFYEQLLNGKVDAQAGRKIMNDDKITLETMKDVFQRTFLNDPQRNVLNPTMLWFQASNHPNSEISFLPKDIIKIIASKSINLASFESFKFWTHMVNTSYENHFNQLLNIKFHKSLLKPGNPNFRNIEKTIHDLKSKINMTYCTLPNDLIPQKETLNRLPGMKVRNRF